MKTFLKCIAVAGFGLPAFAAVINLAVNEKTTALVSAAGFNSGNVVLCDAFNVGSQICTGSNISDLLQFAGNSFIGYFSDNAEGAEPGDTRDIGIPTFDPTFGAGTRYFLEPIVGGTEVLTYNPTPNDPGGATNGVDSNSFTITSDSPEPGTLILLGAGLIAVAARRALRVL